MNELMALIGSLRVRRDPALFRGGLRRARTDDLSLSPHVRYAVISRWAKTMIWLAEGRICGVPLPHRGHRAPAERAPASSSRSISRRGRPCLPGAAAGGCGCRTGNCRDSVLGWGLAMTSPIAIDRNAGREALDEMVERGGDHLRDGLWMVMLPEERAGRARRGGSAAGPRRRRVLRDAGSMKVVRSRTQRRHRGRAAPS